MNEKHRQRSHPADRSRSGSAGGNSTSAKTVASKLRRAYPQARCALHHEDAYQLLVATILSAQCTDDRVNQVTPALFARYPTPADLAAAAPAELEQMIRSTGFYRNKAKALQNAARDICQKFDGRVPQSMQGLTSLQGVARKTANVVLGTAFGIHEGIVIDTHVKRVAHRLGLTRQSHPEKIEQDLMGLFPRKQWDQIAHLLIWHGRRICRARRPLCEECPLERECPKIGVGGR